jgi:phosphoribosyl 1,2-cyclic phosphodiesterase
MKIKVISSGSKGNSTFIESNGTRLLIDVGVPFARIKNDLETIGEDINKIDGILISHEHSDHLGGLGSLNKKIDAPIYIRKALSSAVKNVVRNEDIVLIDDDIKIGTLTITLFNTSHDVPNTGYIIEDGNKSLVYMTDTGYVSKKNIDITKNKTAYIIESNHDEEMLMNGPYPFILKHRVLSDTGHLSNKSSTSYLKKVIGDNTKYIILAHISENNNTYDMALENAKNELEGLFNQDNIIIAYQKDGANLIEI